MAPTSQTTTVAWLRRLSPREYVVFLLGRREYSEKELRQRLGRRECTLEETNDALKFVQSHALQSDQRYAASRTRTEGRRKGDRAIRYALLAQGIDAERIEEKLAEIAPEAQRALGAVRRYAGKPLDAKLTAKIWRFMQRRGFSVPSIKVALASLGGEEGLPR